MRVRRRTGLFRLALTAILLVAGLPMLRPWLWPEPLTPLAGASAALLPGEIVVDLKDGAAPSRVAEMSARLGVRLTPNSIHSALWGLMRATVPSGTERRVLDALSREPIVEQASQDSRIEAYWRPNDPRYQEQWNLRMIHAERAWDRSRGKGVTVAVIDTGVAFENDERCYRAIDFHETQFAKGYDFIHDDDHPYDDNGHGTHVAGTIAESTNNREGVAGLAFEARVMPLKVLSAGGMGSSADIADAIRYAADHGARVINMSLGGPFPDPIMRSACRYAAGKGVLLVCAAGNSKGAVGYPAAFPECLAVSAVDSRGELAWYSSRGKQVALAAPGGDTREGPSGGILQNTVITEAGQREDGYFALQGTSMATPHVAAAAALVMAQGISDPLQVRKVLEASAAPRAPKTHFGAGLLDAGAATARSQGAGAYGATRNLASGLLLGLFLCLGAAATRGKPGIPVLTIGFAAGLLLPDWSLAWTGSGSPWNLLIHGCLLPLYFLWEAGSVRGYRIAGAFAAGMGLQLLLDLWGGAGAPQAFGLATDTEATAWMWLCAVVCFGAAVVAYRRSYCAEQN